MADEGAEQVFVFRTGRRAMARFLVLSLVLLVMAFVITVGHRGAGDLVVGIACLLMFSLSALWHGWMFVTRPAVVILRATGLQARAAPLGRFPEPVRWHTIRGFEISWRRPAPLTRRQQVLGVLLEHPEKGRWNTRSYRWAASRYGTPYVISAAFLDGGLEQIVDAARSFTDVPLTFPASSQPRRRALTRQ